MDLMRPSSPDTSRMAAAVINVHKVGGPGLSQKGTLKDQNCPEGLIKLETSPGPFPPRRAAGTLRLP